MSISLLRCQGDLSIVPALPMRGLEHFRAMVRNRTAVIIIHRLTAAMWANLIYLMNYWG